MVKGKVKVQFDNEELSLFFLLHAVDFFIGMKDWGHYIHSVSLVFKKTSLKQEIRARLRLRQYRVKVLTLNSHNLKISNIIFI